MNAQQLVNELKLLLTVNIISIALAQVNKFILKGYIQSEVNLKRPQHSKYRTMMMIARQLRDPQNDIDENN